MMGLDFRQTDEQRSDAVAKAALLEAVAVVEGYAVEHRANAKANANNGHYPTPADLEKSAKLCDAAAGKLRGWADSLDPDGADG